MTKTVWIMLALVAFSLVASSLLPSGDILGMAIGGFVFGWALAKMT